MNAYFLFVILTACGIFWILGTLAALVHPALMGPAAIVSLVIAGYVARGAHRWAEKQVNRAHRPIR